MQLGNASTDDDDGRQRKRIRASAACIACRDVKTKCLSAGRSERCRRCIDLNLSCVYADSLRSKTGKGDSVRELKTTVGQLRQELDEIRRSAETQSQQLPRPNALPHTLPILDLAVSPVRHHISPNDFHSLFSESSSSTDTLASRNDTSPANLLNDEPTSHNPLNMLYEASMRTFMDEKDKASIGEESQKLQRKSSRLDKETSTLLPSMASVGTHSEEKTHLLSARRSASETEILAVEPELIQQGTIDWTQARQLFKNYFRYCNQHIMILDPTLHTLNEVVRRSHFLFTVICFVASRYSDKEDLDLEAIFDVAMRMAKDLMLTSDSVDTVQGLLLLAAWSRRTRKSGDQIAWMLSGAAIRMAIGARLHEDLTQKGGQKESTSNITSLETVNRQRTWLLCYAADRHISALTGNQPMMREEVLIRACRSWCQQKESRPWDAAISCYVDLLKIQSRQFEQLYAMSSFESTASHNGVHDLVRMFNDQLNEWREEWTAILTTSVERALASGLELDSLILDNIGHQLPLRLGHARLMLNSFALSQVTRKSQTKEESAQFAYNCWMAAKDVVYAVSLGSNMRYSPDDQFIMVAFACVTLLKLKQTPFAQSLAYLGAQEIRKIVSDTAESLDKLAIDREHSPALFASFLRHILVKDAEGDSIVRSTSNTAGTLDGNELQPTSEAVLDCDNLLWLSGSDQLLFNNALYSAPSQTCLGDDFWDALLPSLSGPSMGTPSWLARYR